MSTLHDPSFSISNLSRDNDVLIKVEGVSKKFCRDLKKSLWYGVKDVASELLPIQNSKSKIQHSGDALRPGEFWANKDISFELRRGECLGLIGHNGAGKTTLLKMLNGLIKPDSGRIEMRGRIGALIALGAGFNPILTGRENVYVNASILGLNKLEIDSKMRDIIEFAEIEEFIDSPVQSYSSGMQVRLGFAVATALEPDILILDEVLAVGDAAFRNKCYNRIGNLQKQASVIFVSHSMEQIARVCTNGLFLHKGKTSGVLSVQEAVDAYEMQNSLEHSDSEYFCKISHPIEAASFELGESEISMGCGFSAKITVHSAKELVHPFLRLFFFAQDGSLAAEWNSEILPDNLRVDAGVSSIDIFLPSLMLRPNTYKVSFIMHEKNSINQPIWFHKYHAIKVNGVKTGACSNLIKGKITYQKK